jgi:hypothetical protein
VTVVSSIGLVSDLAQDDFLETCQLLAERSTIAVSNRGTYADLASMDLLGVVLVTTFLLRLALVLAPFLAFTFSTVPVRLGWTVYVDLLGHAAVVGDRLDVRVVLVRLRLGVRCSAM